jgi:hypothetical protein
MFPIAGHRSGYEKTVIRAGELFAIFLERSENTVFMNVYLNVFAINKSISQRE